MKKISKILKREIGLEEKEISKTMQN